jgi:hypothetical protein
LTINGAYAKNGRIRTIALNGLGHDALTRHPTRQRGMGVYNDERHPV